MVLDRRGFMKFMAGASAGVMVTPIPWKLLDDVSIWTQSWPWIPSNEKGANSFTHVVSKMCPSGVPMKIRLVDGRPVRVLPVEGHPLGGGVTALAVAEVQMMYSPGRVTRPLKRAPDGGFIEISWKEAAGTMLAEMKKAKGNTAFISGDETGSTNEVMSALAKAMGSDAMFLMPSEAQCASRAAALMGIPAQFGYDIENSDYVLALGANVLESWGTVVRNRRVFRDSHEPCVSNAEKGIKPKGPSVPFAYAGSVQNGTAAVATPWLPIYPGTEGILALGIANMLISQGRMANAADFGAFKNLAARYTPAETARLTGVDVKKLEGVIKALLAAKAPLVIVGSEFGQGAGAAPVMAGVALNALLGNINRRGGMTMLPQLDVVMKNAMPRDEIYKKDLAAWFQSKPSPAMLVLHEANPVYALPNPEGVRQALKAIPFKVSFTTFMDETAEESDLVLPIPMGLERVDDVENPYGTGTNIYCITTAASEPQADVIGTANTLLYLAKELGIDLGFKMYQDLLKAKALTYEKCSFDILAAGQAGVVNTVVDASGFRLRPDILQKALQPKPLGDNMGLAVYSKLSMGTAKTGIPPYNTKTIRADELAPDAMFVMMNGATASKKGLANGDKVLLDSGRGSIPARLRVFEGVMNDTVAVLLGFGHTALDEFSRNKGANVMELMGAAPEPETGLTVWSKTGVNVIKA